MGNQKSVIDMVKDMEFMKEITQSQGRNIIKDLKDPDKLKNIQETLARASLKDILRLYIKANYYDGNFHHESKVEEKHTSKMIQQSTLKQRINDFSGNKIIQQFTSFFETFKDKYTLSIRFLSEMVCNQTGKAVQSYISKLLEHLINTTVFSYMKYSESSVKPKIQFFDSSHNYMTIYLEGESRFKQIQMISVQIESGIYDKSNNLLYQLFQIKEDQNSIFLVEDSSEDRTIFKLSVSDDRFFSVLKTSSQMHKLFSMFVDKIIETLHRCKFQTSNVQYTVKSMIHIVEFCLKMNNLLGQRRLLQVIQQETKTRYDSLSQYLTDKKSIDPNNEEIKFIQQISENFSRNAAKYQSRINVYKSELSDSSVVFMDFDRFGVLRFLSNRLPSVQFNRLRMKLSKNTETIRIMDIFKENSQVIRHFKHAFNEILSTEPIYFHEDSYPGQIAFAYDTNGELIRTHIHIFLRQSKRSEGSFRNFLSVKSIISSDSQKDVNKIIKQSTGINGQAKKRLIDIESETPGVTKFGWLQLFVKNQVIDKYKRKFSESSVCIKQDSQQYKKISNVISAQMIAANQSLYTVSPELVERIDIDNYDLNLLELDQALYIPFIQKVFKNVTFFNHSEIDQLKFQNFIFEIQKKYQKHNNPFHNFIHGMNVMHYCYLLSKLSKTASLLSDLDAFTLVFSGLCHDVGHRGFNNNFQIATLSKKSIRWNDRSPLENYHISTAFKILLKPQNNFLDIIKKQHFLHLRKLSILNVLATDIKQHFPIVTNFQNKLKSAANFEKNPADIELLSTFLIHTSDFSGASKNFEISQQWSRRCNKQFSNQYKQQGLLNVPQTPFMKDLDDQSVLGKNQSGFLKVIVRPLYKNLCDFYTNQQSIKKMLINIDDTILVWQKIGLGLKTVNYKYESKDSMDSKSSKYSKYSKKDSKDSRIGKE